jgi:hypothetical protein
MMTILRVLALASILFTLPMQAHANKLVMPGDLIQGHAKEEDNCEKCHKKFDKGAQSRLCADCHKDVGKDLAEKRGFHGRIKEQKECKECHPDHKGRDAIIVTLDKDAFDHNQTDYALKGKHTDPKVKCDSCHKKGKKYSEAPNTCNECHKKDDKHKGNFGPKCESCHIEKDWKEIQFDHAKRTKYPLLGKHKTAKCNACHKGDLFKDKLKTNCNSCHEKDDKHKGHFGAKCETCHVEQDWKEILFDHDKKTKYPLVGKHKDAKCSGCHKGDLYKDKIKSTACNSCHQKDDKHKGSFGPKCESCHVERDWKEVLFDHDKKTKYPLLGKHKQAKCSGCHKGDIYKDKITDKSCNACHQKDDKHKSNFGPKCETCHVERDWKEVLFNHDKDTKYPLVAKHKDAKCVGCHKGNLYQDKLQTNCFFCHEKDDKHKGQEGKKCESCHAEVSWTKTTFDHQRMSTFPLLGKHFLVACKKCHSAVTFKDVKTDCFSCHEKDDVHKQKLGSACESCHNTRDWKAWDFNHDKTGFKLDGPHAKVGCYKCHQKPMTKKLVASSTCGSCHDKDDIHNGDYGPQCNRCHEGNSWKGLKAGIMRK